MNPDDLHTADSAMPAELRLQLRALRRDTPPARDLWPDIAARLGAPVPAVARRAPRTRWLALAAAVCAATVIGWQAWPTAPGGVPLTTSAAADGAPVTTAAAADGAPVTMTAGPDVATVTTAAAARPSAGPKPPPLLREADAMGREYDAALLEMRHAAVAPYPADAFAELERSAAEIHAALAHHPDSRFLLDRLQRVHAHRLALARRLA